MSEQKNLENFNEAEKKFDSFMNSLDINKFKKQESIYKIDHDDASKLLFIFDSCKIPSKYFSAKDVLREKFIQIFHLEKNDTVIFLENIIYIKLFTKLETADKKEKRACGIEPEVLENYKNEYFKNGTHKKLILLALPYIIEDILNFRKITPVEFQSLFIPVFVNLIEIFVIEHTKLSDLKSIRGMSYYLFRELFEDIMLYVAEDILFNFSNKEKKAADFLNLFNVNEKIDLKGIKYKANPILDENNNVWNITSIKTTLIQHKKDKQAIYDKKNTLIYIKRKLSSNKSKERILINKKHKEEAQIKDIDIKLSHTKKTLNKLQSSTSDKIKFIDKGIEKVYDKKPLIVKILKKENDLLSIKTMLKKEVENIELDISNRKKDFQIWEKKYNEESDILAQMKTNDSPIDHPYNNIKKALAKTLARR